MIASKELRYWFISLLILSGCNKEEKKQNFTPVVGVIHVNEESVPLEFESAGKIYGALDIQVRAQVNGILKERRFIEGQYIKKGESLFLIDPAPYQAAVNRAEGNVAQAESEQRRTKRDFDRMEKLFKRKAVSQKEHDDALSALERAEANLKIAKAGLQEARINLEYTDVKAPISGYVRGEYQTIGNLVSVAGESSLLTSMVQLDKVRVNFSVADTFWKKAFELAENGMAIIPDISKLKVSVMLPNNKVHPQTGRIVFVDSAEDSITSTIAMRAEIPNKDASLTPGQFVRVKVSGASYKCPVVPNSCILASANGSVVFVVGENNKAQIRPVKVRLLGNKAIILDGLKAGEKVVYEGLIKVRDGAPITPVMKDKPAEKVNSAAKVK